MIRAALHCIIPQAWPMAYGLYTASKKVQGSQNALLSLLLHGLFSACPSTFVDYDVVIFTA